MTGGPALVTFVLYITGVLALAWLANRVGRKRSFLSEYFLGGRTLGVWAFALTFAATSSSGGSFTGFPSKIYSHGWILALWIGSYMVVPICMMGLLGKRLNQVARISGAITVPDVFRDRFNCAAFGLLATGLIVFFMSFNLVAQFKAGSLILRTLLDGISAFQATSQYLGSGVRDWPLFGGADPQYLLCLLIFGVVVVVYTTYGGFRAVVWTDIMQGVVMVVGVVILLPLTLIQAGGLERVTQEMAQMTPPRPGVADLIFTPAPRERIVAAGVWARVEDGDGTRHLVRLTGPTVIAAGARRVDDVAILELTTATQIQRLDDAADTPWLDDDLRLTHLRTTAYASGEAPGAYVTGPGPSLHESDGFLPLSLAVSFFIMWAIAGTGQPGNFVRLMAFRDNRTLRHAIATVTIYYSLIYFPLILIFCCARVLLPGMESESDRIMPAMVLFVTDNAGLAWLGGLVVAAPFAAVMSTVDSFLLMISSALVRDVYQRTLRPEAQERLMRRLSFAATLLVGTGAVLGAIDPPRFLQDIIVYTGSGLAASFLAPTVFALYQPRANTPGCMAGMLAGFGTHLAMYGAGIFAHGSFFRPVQLFGLDPILVGLAVSFLVTYITIHATAPPPAELVQRYFCRD
jgi:Na+/pantothenate symporter